MRRDQTPLAASKRTALLELARSCWEDACRGAYLVPSACTDMDELLLLFDVDPEAAPGVNHLRRL